MDGCVIGTSQAALLRLTAATGCGNFRKKTGTRNSERREKEYIYYANTLS